MSIVILSNKTVMLYRLQSITPRGLSQSRHLINSVPNSLNGRFSADVTPIPPVFSTTIPISLNVLQPRNRSGSRPFLVEQPLLERVLSRNFHSTGCQSSSDKMPGWKAEKGTLVLPKINRFNPSSQKERGS